MRKEDDESREQHQALLSLFFPSSLSPSPLLELQSLLSGHQHSSPSFLALLVLPPGLALGQLRRATMVCVDPEKGGGRREGRKEGVGSSGGGRRRKGRRRKGRRRTRRQKNVTYVVNREGQRSVVCKCVKRLCVNE